MGGYLAGGNGSLSNGTIGYFDATHVILFTQTPISIDNGAGEKFFFGFESLVDSIKFIVIDPTASQFAFQLDNVTTEIVTPLPTALPLFATGLGALGLRAWRRKRKAGRRI